WYPKQSSRSTVCPSFLPFPFSMRVPGCFRSRLQAPAGFFVLDGWRQYTDADVFYTAQNPSAM
ncbi:hypothetical protein LJC61_05605, partial [Ruminococcaceae bacterium OttesenSCG-928-A16]|nr:hypothetical protein [Ruminococcaceae bacterium OttesenSCG-928-A16]